MRYRTRFNAVGGVNDFIQEWKKPTPHRWPILGAAFLMTGSLFFWLAGENYYYPPEMPKVTYISTFADGRTDAEIRASNIENQQRKDALAAEQAERLELRREFYREVGAASGLDVDAMEAQIKEDEAAAAEAERARLEALFDAESDGQDDNPE